MGRPTEVKLAVVLLCCLIAVELGVACFNAIGVAVALKGGIYFGPDPRPGWIAWGLVAVCVCALILAGWGTATVRGLVGKKVWAMASLRILGGCYAVLGVCLLVTGVIAEMRTPLGRASTNPLFYGARLVVHLPMFWFEIALTLVGIWWVRNFDSRARADAPTQRLQD